MHFTESLFSPSLSCLRERQLHKQALVITVLPIPVVVPVPLSSFLSFSVSFCLFPHIVFPSCLFLIPLCVSISLVKAFCVCWDAAFHYTIVKIIDT